uniref:ATP synthase subunit d, mitochondrial n=1 Tax=Hucho hucho TaxID=62062 RepID=A0A4W5L1D6_9TELE
MMCCWRVFSFLFWAAFVFCDPSVSLCVCSHRLNSLPEKSVVIDWSYYKTALARAGMVDDFEKKVEPFRK